MKIINFAETPSLVGQYMTELRDVDAQHDMLRFRANLERIGQIMAYEISKTLAYATRRIDTPLSPADSPCSSRRWCSPPSSAPASPSTPVF